MSTSEDMDAGTLADDLKQVPYVGDPIQLHVGDHESPRPGQISEVMDDGSSGFVNLIAWNPVSAGFHVYRAVVHGPGRGFPFWLFPGEDA